MGAIVVGDAVVGAAVVGDVVDTTVVVGVMVGATVVGVTVGGAVVGATVVRASVVGAMVGATGVGVTVGGTVLGYVVGATVVVGAAVVVGAVVGGGGRGRKGRRRSGRGGAFVVTEKASVECVEPGNEDDGHGLRNSAQKAISTVQAKREKQSTGKWRLGGLDSPPGLRGPGGQNVIQYGNKCQGISRKYCVRQMLAHADAEGRSPARGRECYAMASARECKGCNGYVKCRHTHADAEDQREKGNKTVMVRK